MRFSIVLAALCGFAVGLLSSLLVMQIGGDSYADIKQERDKAVAAQVATTGELAKQTQELDDLKQHHEVELGKLQGRFDAAEADAKHSKEMAKDATGDALKVQAFVAILMKLPAVRDTYLTEEFQSSYEAGWLYPDAAYKLIGGRWFVEELVTKGLLPKDALDSTPELNAIATADPISQQEPLSWLFVNGTRTTDSFQINSRKWKLSWFLNKTDQGSMRHIQLVVHRKDSDGTDTIAGSALSEANGDTIIRSEPGNFYMEANVINAEAVVEIEELPD